MKKLITFLSLVVSIILFAQAPQGLNYQATVRNNSGALIVNKNVYFKFNIIQNSQTNVPVYSETHYVPTDDVGQVNLTIGQGTPTSGTFSGINWALAPHFLGIELNTGTGYVAMGITQLMSVPYAQYAQNSGNGSSPPDLASVLAKNNSTNNTQIKNIQNPTDTQDAATKGYLDTAIAQIQSQITELQNAFESNTSGTGQFVVKGATWSGECYSSPTKVAGCSGIDVEIYASGRWFKILNMPTASSGIYSINRSFDSNELDNVYDGAYRTCSTSALGHAHNFLESVNGNITKTGTNSFTFSCTVAVQGILYDNNGNATYTSATVTGSGKYN